MYMLSEFETHLKSEERENVERERIVERESSNFFFFIPSSFPLLFCSFFFNMENREEKGWRCRRVYTYTLICTFKKEKWSFKHKRTKLPNNLWNRLDQAIGYNPNQAIGWELKVAITWISSNRLAEQALGKQPIAWPGTGTNRLVEAVSQIVWQLHSFTFKTHFLLY